MKIKEFIKKVFFFLKKKISIYGIIAIVLIIAGIFIFGNKKTTEQTKIIKTGDFVQQVSVSGKVIASQDVSLSFKNGGRIKSIYSSVGQIVKSGTLIARVDATDAEKNMHDAEIDLANAKLSLEKLKLQNSEENMNSDLQKAYDDGFTSVNDTFLDLQVILTGIDNLLAENNLSDNAARMIGNTATNFRNQAENLYYSADKAFQVNKINFRKINRESSKVDIENIINETYNTVKILADTIKSTKNFVDYMSDDTGIASDFISAQEKITSYTNIISTHLADLLSIKTIIKNYQDAFPSTSLDIQSLELSIKQKENSLQDARNKLEDYYIRAPFLGVITKIDAKVGEMASFNVPLITMMSADTFQVESYIPEINISKIKIGDNAKITLDAYGGDVSFDANVISIDPAETIKDGVSTYKVKLQFTEKDERIKSGMTANVLITVFNKTNTIVVPGGIVFDKNSKKFVQVKENGENVNREIIIGSASALGQVEILSGLKDGDIVILNPILK